MRNFLLTVLFLCALAVVRPVYALDPSSFKPFPLGHTVDTSFGSTGESAVFSCRVDRIEKTGDTFYRYYVAFAYKGERSGFISWQLPNFILSQYPNAAKTQMFNRVLFPIGGKNKYEFTFISTEVPVWVETLAVFYFVPEAGSSEEAEDWSDNKEVAEWGGVTVSTHSYIQSGLMLGAAGCLPPSLTVFINSQNLFLDD